MKKSPLKKHSRNPLSIKRKKVWKLMSEYVRRSENGVCFTCGIKKDWREMDAGHFIHKDCLDYDFVNIHCQCSRCNRFMHGNLGEYAIRLINKYGKKRIEKLRMKGNQIKKFTIKELDDIERELKAMLLIIRNV